MSSERALWQLTKSKFALFGLMKRVENLVEPGTPDVTYLLRMPNWPKTRESASGWLELKWLRSFPLNPDAPIRIDHLKLEQVIWAEDWVRAGGRCFCLLQVADNYFLIDPPLLRAIYRMNINQQQLWDKALAASEEGLPTKWILTWLTK